MGAVLTEWEWWDVHFVASDCVWVALAQLRCCASSCGTRRGVLGRSSFEVGMRVGFVSLFMYRKPAALQVEVDHRADHRSPADEEHDDCHDPCVHGVQIAQLCQEQA